MFGHKDIKTTLRYTRSDVEDVRAVMEAVERHNPDTQSAGQEGKSKVTSNLASPEHPLPKQALYQAEPRRGRNLIVLGARSKNCERVPCPRDLFSRSWAKSHIDITLRVRPRPARGGSETI